jgi:DNA polymerase
MFRARRLWYNSPGEREEQMQLDLFDDGLNWILGAKTYQEFSKRLLEADCKRCGLCSGRHNVVVDRGNPEASLVVIGEGPGEQEDLQGKAFVGRAGKLLDSIMESIGLSTDRDMLILNVIKCRPPDNRVPKAEEAAACIPYLRKQLDLVSPKMIALLGATSLKHMDNSRKNFSMSEEAGRFFKLPSYPDAEFVVLYHPAALLYNAGLKRDMWNHVKELKKRLGELGVLG